jgi:hypothetical protein
LKERIGFAVAHQLEPQLVAQSLGLVLRTAQKHLVDAPGCLLDASQRETLPGSFRVPSIPEHPSPLSSAIHQQPTIYKTLFGRRFVRDQEKLRDLDSNQD